MLKIKYSQLTFQPLQEQEMLLMLLMRQQASLPT
jgi:hypothetical protein